MPDQVKLLRLAGVRDGDLARLAKKTLRTLEEQLEAKKLFIRKDGVGRETVFETIEVTDNTARNLAIRSAKEVLGLGRSKTAEAVQAKKQPQVVVIMPTWAQPVVPERRRPIIDVTPADK